MTRKGSRGAKRSLGCRLADEPTQPVRPAPDRLAKTAAHSKMVEWCRLPWIIAGQDKARSKSFFEIGTPGVDRSRTTANTCVPFYLHPIWAEGSVVKARQKPDELDRGNS